MRDRSAQSRLIGLIYDAAIEPMLWPEAMEALARAIGARSGILYRFDLGRRRAEQIASLNLDPGLQPAYESHYCRIDAWNQRVQSMPAGQILPTQHLIADRELERSEFYADILRPQDIFYATGGMVERDPSGFAVFGLQRGRRAGPFGDAETRHLAQVFPHLRRSLRIRRELQAALAARDLLADALDAMGDGVMILNARSRLLFRSRAAARYLREGGRLRLVRERLAGATAAETAVLQAAVARAAATAGGRASASGGSLTLARVGALPLMLTVSPLRHPAMGAAAVLFIRDPMRETAPLDQFRRRFGLTAAEIRLVRGLAAGGTLKGLAEEFDVSINTLRVQLRQVFAKTGVNRQVDLVRLVAEAASPMLPES